MYTHHRRIRRWTRIAAGVALALSALGLGTGIPGTHSITHAQTAGAPTWTPIGPIPGAQANGRVLTIAVDPNGKLYVGGPGGVWTSTNNGQSWATTTDQQTAIDVGSIAIDPNKLPNPTDANNPYAVYAGTGDVGGVTALPGQGVLKSMDGGATWTNLNPNGVLSGAHTTQLAIDPRGSVLYDATDRGIFVSTDGGATFPTTLLQGQQVTALVLDTTTNPTTLFAAVQDTGIEKSADGKNFTVLAGGLPAGNQFGRTALAIAPSNHLVLYASVGMRGGTNTLTGVYKTVDGGAAWTQLANALDFTQYSNGQGGQAFANNVLSVKPDDPNTVYGAGVNLARSTDGGATWTNLSANGLATSGLGGDFHALVFDSKGNLFTGSDLGIAEQSSTGVISNLNSNLNTIMFYPGVAQVDNGTLITGGAQDNAIWVYTGSPQWRLGVNADGFQTAIDPLNPSIMYGTTDSGLYKTTDQWQMVQTKITPTVPSGAGIWPKPLAVAPNVNTPDAPTVYYGADKVYSSGDGGTTFTNGGYALPGSFNGVSAIAVAPSNANVVYAGFTDGTVEVSTNRGTNWTTLAPPSGAPNCNNCVGQYISHITVDPTNESNITVTFGGSSVPHNSPAPPHVVQGTNAETATPTWTEVTGNLPNDAANSVVYSGSGLIVATDTGVYTGAPPNGANAAWNWVSTAAGLPRVPVYDLALTPAGTLIALTFGRGAWTTTVPTISPNGTGTMTVTPALVKSGTGGLTETFTYTAGNGGLNNGEVDLSVPAAWTAPSAANTSASTGNLAVNGNTIAVTGVTLPAGGMLTITYGTQGNTVTSPAVNGTSTFVTRTQSGATPPLTAIAKAPTITATTTGGTVPAAPTGVTVTPGTAGICGAGGASINVNWNAPPFDGGSPVTSYHIVLSPGGLSTDQDASNGTGLQNLCGLSATTAYAATVSATNANGMGPASAPSMAVTAAHTPAAPQNVQTITGNGQVEVMWQPPATNNGGALTGYTITAQPGSETMTVSPETHSASLGGLTNGTNYSVTVQADNQYGKGSAGNAPQMVDPSTTANIPDPPTDVIAEPGDGQATVSWTAPGNNGSPIQHYTVTAYPGGATKEVSGSQTSTLITGLDNGTGYTFTVTATNGVGDSPASEPSGDLQGAPDHGTGDVMATYPGAPQNVQAVAGNAQAIVTWDEPSDDGGYELGRYLVVAHPGNQHVEVDALENSAIVTGLTNGSHYTFTVTAFSDFGGSPASDPSNTVIPQTCTTVFNARSSVVLAAGRYCVSGRIPGAVTVGRGATVTITNATISGGITAVGAASVRLCGSTVGGTTAIANTTGFTLIGDTTDDACDGNALHAVSLTNNHGGLDFEDNTQAGVVKINGNYGVGPMPDDGAAEIGNNDITGLLSCANNFPTPTDDLRPNVGAGFEAGQCANL